MVGEFQVDGHNSAALFTLRIHRGDGMSLVAMNWKKGKPPVNFVGFTIEYKEPGGDKFYALKNRLTFPSASATDPNRLSTLRSPIQKFRWVHFPRNAELEGDFTYRISPVFMNDKNELSYGEVQEAKLELRRETYPGQLNVAFTRGFVSSQASSTGTNQSAAFCQRRRIRDLNSSRRILKRRTPLTGWVSRPGKKFFQCSTRLSLTSTLRFASWPTT